MGDMADYYMDLAMQQDAEYEAYQHQIGEELNRIEKEYSFGILKWNSMNGKVMVTKMSVEHINNTIAFIKRTDKTEVGCKWVEIFEYELEKR